MDKISPRELREADNPLKMLFGPLFPEDLTEREIESIVRDVMEDEVIPTEEVRRIARDEVDRTVPSMNEITREIEGWGIDAFENTMNYVTAGELSPLLDELRIELEEQIIGAEEFEELEDSLIAQITDVESEMQDLMEEFEMDFGILEKDLFDEFDDLRDDLEGDILNLDGDVDEIFSRMGDFENWSDDIDDFLSDIMGEMGKIPLTAEDVFKIITMGQAPPDIDPPEGLPGPPDNDEIEPGKGVVELNVTLGDPGIVPGAPTFQYTFNGETDTAERGDRVVLSAGTYDYEFTAPGHSPATGTVVVNEGVATTLTEGLSPHAPPGTPPGAPTPMMEATRAEIDNFTDSIFALADEDVPKLLGSVGQHQEIPAEYLPDNIPTLADLEDVEGDINSLMGDLGDLERDFAALEIPTFADFEDEITNLTLDDFELGEFGEALEFMESAKIPMMESQVDILQGALGELQDDFELIENLRDKLTSPLSDLKSSIGTAEVQTKATFPHVIRDLDPSLSWRNIDIGITDFDIPDGVTLNIPGLSELEEWMEDMVAMFEDLKRFTEQMEVALAP